MIRNVNHVLFRHEGDMEAIKRFFEDFGLFVSHEDERRVYFRGYESRPFIYVAERGPRSFGGLGFEVESAEALEALARRFDVPVTDGATPWGGRQIAIEDADGNAIELVHGLRQLEPVALPRPPVPLNTGNIVQRRGRFPIFERGPAPVLRLAHVVQNTPDPGRLMDWYVDNLGAYLSDVIMVGEHRAGAFIRFPRGKDYVDHHNIAVFQGPANTAQHACFETIDVDAVHMGHQHLAAKGYRPAWGVLRHAVGGALSDYWYDPSDFRVEHVTDSDYLNDEYPTGYHQRGPETAMQWGGDMPDHFRD
ncbi:MULTISPECIES: VOC family protein [unclassified Sphingopyxis]|jgi:hypothetical protein|uniref:VOC family protein n=1 Tax=Sphingopyxis sp. DBS4 TaxID=2968500 RepID=UPI00214CA646|nr:VOC family protein [Sphingopyxis sp. DBS4]